MIDRALEESNKLNSIGHAMDDLLGSGAAILGDLRNQRSTLKVCVVSRCTALTGISGVFCYLW